MGHTRLGYNLPRSRHWRDVVELVAAGADVSQVAQATINAAEKAFAFVKNDTGYNHAVWIIIQLGLAGKSADPLGYLQERGICIPANTSLPGIAVALSEAFDNHSRSNGGFSDLGELSQRALIDAVIQRIEPKLQQKSLFNMQAEHAQQALCGISSQKELGKLAREFYARLTNESLKYFLSQTLASNVGEGQRFATTNQMAQFEEAIGTHCKEASVIVERFSEEWFSKHRYEQEGKFPDDKIRDFASYALKKMNDELREGAKTNAT